MIGINAASTLLYRGHYSRERRLAQTRGLSRRYKCHTSFNLRVDGVDDTRNSDSPVPALRGHGGRARPRWATEWEAVESLKHLSSLSRPKLHGILTEAVFGKPNSVGFETRFKEFAVYAVAQRT